ncbi:MAG: hypothetical protein ABIG11_11050 [bacterium]
MRPTILGMIFGWLLSSWVQVPPPLQGTVKHTVRAAVEFMKARITKALTDIPPHERRADAGKNAPGGGKD